MGRHHVKSMQHHAGSMLHTITPESPADVSQDPVKSTPEVAEKADPREGKTLHLTKVERLELQNIQYRQQLLDIQVQREAQQLAAERDEWTKRVSERVGEDIADYAINLATGSCQFSAEAAKGNAAQKAQKALQKAADTDGVPVSESKPPPA